MGVGRRWDEDFMILVHEPEAEKLTVALYHRSSFGPADEIGRCQVCCRALCRTLSEATTLRSTGLLGVVDETHDALWALLCRVSPIGNLVPG